MSKSGDNNTVAMIGVLCGVAVGALMVFLYYRTRSAPKGLAGQLGLGDDFDELEAGGDPLDALEARSRGSREVVWRGRKIGRGPDLSHTAHPRVVPVARSFTIMEAQPTMLLQAVGHRDWTVWVRNVGPSGSFATFMIGDNPGNSVIVPAGDRQPMRIPHGEYLYAQGDVNGVVVSVSGGPDT